MSILPCTFLPHPMTDTMARHLMGDIYTHSLVFNLETHQWNRTTYDGQKLSRLNQMSDLAIRAVAKLESLNWMAHHQIIALVGMVTDARMHTGWGRPSPGATYCPNGGAFVGNILIRDCRQNTVTMGTPICVHAYATPAIAPERGMIDFMNDLVDSSAFRRTIRTAHLATRMVTR